MVEKLFHWASGYAEFAVHGDAARFFTVCAKRGFDFWDFSRSEGVATARCRVQEYRLLLPTVRRCRVCLHCRKKSGLPFIMSRMARRKGLLLGTVFGILLFAFLNSFIWSVQVEGTERLSEQQVLAAARASGVAIGTAKRAVQPKLTDHRIMELLPQAKWVSVNTHGCTVDILLGEKEEAPLQEMETGYSNIVASQAGVVRAIEAHQGRPEVVIGQTVDAGDLLISGLYQDVSDPYGPQPEEPLQVAGPARGSVVAETYREFAVQVPAKRTRNVPTGQRRAFSTLRIFSLNLPLGFGWQTERPGTQYTETTQLHLLGQDLPVYLEKRTTVFTKQVTVSLSAEEQRSAAILKLREAQRAWVAPGGKILREDLQFSFSDGICILTAQCHCLEEIGVNREILVK